MHRRVALLITGLALVAMLWFLNRPGSQQAAAATETSGVEPAESDGVEAESAPLSPALARDLAIQAPTAAELRAAARAKSKAALQTFTVVVFDQDGLPMSGVFLDTHDSLEQGPFRHNLWVTDQEGRAVIPGLAPEDARSLFVRVDWIGSVSVGARLSPGVDAALPVEIRLPPYGHVEVEIAPDLSELRSAGVRRTGVLQLNPAAAARWMQCKDGFARFSLIELDQDLIVSLAGSPGGSALERNVRGPEKAGQTVRVRFEAGTSSILTGSLVDESGVQLRNLEVQFTIFGEHLDLSHNVKTDDLGRFRIPVPAKALATILQEIVFRRLAQSAKSAESAAITISGFGFQKVELARAGRARLPAKLPAGNLDLGAIVMSAESVFVAGQVRTRSGTPVAGASLLVEERYVSARTGLEEWQLRDVALVAQSAEDGSFAVYGPQTTNPVRIRVTSYSHVPFDPLEFAYGEANLQIVLSEGGSFQGSMLWPFEISAAGLEVGLSTGHTGLRAAGKIRDDVYYLDVPGLAAGNYDFVVRFNNRGAELLRFAGILIEDGKPSTDARIQNLDLRPFLGSLTVTPRGPDGRLPPDCIVWRLSTDGASGNSSGGFDATGRKTMLCPKDGLDIVIEAPGLRSLYLPKAIGSIEPVLEPAIDFTVRVIGEAAMTNELGSFEIAVTPLAAPGLSLLQIRRGHGRKQTSLDATRSARFSADVLGAWEVSLMVPTASPGGKITFQAVFTARIEIGPGDAGRTFQVELLALPD